jgi:hypothetical protein
VPRTPIIEKDLPLEVWPYAKSEAVYSNGGERNERDALRAHVSDKEKAKQQPQQSVHMLLGSVHCAHLSFARHPIHTVSQQDNSATETSSLQLAEAQGQQRWCERARAHR